MQFASTLCFGFSLYLQADSKGAIVWHETGDVVNTSLKNFILNVSVAFQFITVLLVSLHKRAMHLY